MYFFPHRTLETPAAMYGPQFGGASSQLAPSRKSVSHPSGSFWLSYDVFGCPHSHVQARGML